MTRLKVCAYCRVSTNSKDQANSFENQQSYFQREITKNAKYSLINIYADKGITGTSLTKRPEFNKMLYDAGLDIVEIKNHNQDDRKDKMKYVCIASTVREPLFNLILVKNTSRFARNVLVEDILRELRKNKVYVHFLDLDKTTENEDDITYIQIFQSFDERESRDKSKKIRFGQKEGMEKNTILCNKLIYGYEYIKDEKRLEIIENESEVIKAIFNMYSQGMGIRRIIGYLTDSGKFTRQGKPFGKTTISKILTNEKYMGFNNRNKYDTGKIFEKFTYAKVKEEYAIKEAFDKIPPIVSQELFYQCKELLLNKVNYINQKGIYKGKTEFVQLIVCGNCGSIYTGNSDRGRHFYNCSLKKTKGSKICSNPNVSLKQINELIDKECKIGFKIALESSIQDSLVVLSSLSNYLFRSIDNDKTEFVKQLEVELNSLKIKEEKLTDIYIDGKLDLDKDIYIKKMKQIAERISSVENEIRELSKSNEEILYDIASIQNTIDEVNSIEVKKIYEKNEVLSQIHSIRVFNDKSLVVRYKVEDLLQVVINKHDFSCYFEDQQLLQECWERDEEKYISRRIKELSQDVAVHEAV